MSVKTYSNTTLEKTRNTFIHKSTNVVEKLKEKQFKVKEEEEEEDDKKKQNATRVWLYSAGGGRRRLLQQECGVQGHTVWRFSWVHLEQHGPQQG